MPAWTDTKISKIYLDPGQELADPSVRGLILRGTEYNRVFYFRYQHRATGARVKLLIGNWAKADRNSYASRTGFSYEEARDIALSYRKLLQQNKDPRDEVRKQKAEEQAKQENTVKARKFDFITYSRELADRGEISKSYFSKIDRNIRKIPRNWSERDLDTITDNEVQDLLHKKPDNELAKVGTRFFSWAVEKRYCAFNPFRGLVKTANSRDVYVESHEISKVWPQLEVWEKLIILTGCRPSEVLGISEQEIDHDIKVVDIPASRMKMKRPHRVMLSDQAYQLLVDSELPFRRKGTKMTVGPAGKYFQSRKVLAKKDLHLHDLRRTTASLLGELLVPQKIIDRVLAHEKKSVSSTYNRHTYDLAARQALQKLADKIEALCEEKVVPMPKIA